MCCSWGIRRTILHDHNWMSQEKCRCTHPALDTFVIWTLSYNCTISNTGLLNHTAGDGTLSYNCTISNTGLTILQVMEAGQPWNEAVVRLNSHMYWFRVATMSTITMSTIPWYVVSISWYTNFSKYHMWNSNTQTPIGLPKMCPNYKISGSAAHIFPVRQCSGYNSWAALPSPAEAAQNGGLGWVGISPDRAPWPGSGTV